MITVARATSTRTPRRAVAILADVGLWVASIAGACCIVLVVVAFTWNITLIMFSTGSMSPTIPTGSVAVVQRIPASEIAVGDVVTVDREGQLPITHRVRTVEPGADASHRVITMRGDANETDDLAPYEVTSVRIVRFAVPGLATVITGFGNPLVLGGVTLAATVLVLVVFWPRARRQGND